MAHPSSTHTLIHTPTLAPFLCHASWHTAQTLHLWAVSNASFCL